MISRLLHLFLLLDEIRLGYNLSMSVMKHPFLLSDL